MINTFDHFVMGADDIRCLEECLRHFYGYPFLEDLYERFEQRYRELVFVCGI